MTASNILWPRMILKSFGHALAPLRQITRLTSFAFPLFCLSLLTQFAVAGTAGNGSLRGGTDHYYCTSNDAGQTTIYFSTEFDFSWPAGTVRVQDSVIGNEFKQALAAKYGYQGSVVCFGTKTTAQTQAQLQSSISGAHSSGKWKVVETGWKWSGAKAGGGASGATGTAQPAAAAGSGQDSSASGESGSASGGSMSGGSMQGGSAEANSGGQAENAPAAGTTVAVRIAEAVDSSRDPAGKQYRGIVLKPADARNGTTILQGSVAMVTLMKVQDGWSAHLQSVMVKGQTVNVASAPATVMGSGQSTVTNAANTVTSAIGSFGGFGHHNRPAAVEAVATGDRVLLPPGTQLQFVLSGGAAPSGAAASGSGMSNSGGMNHPVNAAHPGSGSAHASNAVAASAPSEASPGSLSAKVTETLLGPRKQEGMFVVSPDGGHYAVSAMHGSRSLMIVDGVDGPDYDHAAQQYSGSSIDFVFNADGRHSCYIAQRGDDMVEVRDNKEAYVITTAKPPLNGTISQINQSAIHGPGFSMPGHQCLISLSGAHTAVAGTESPQPGASAAGGFHMFLDGVKSPPYRIIDLNQTAFVGDKLVYVAQTDDQKWHMVVNDKLGPGYASITSLLLNTDDKHYAYIATTGAGHQVVVDGVPGTVRPHAGNGVQ